MYFLSKKQSVVPCKGKSKLFVVGYTKVHKEVFSTTLPTIMSWFNNSGDDGNALAFAKIQAEVMADCFDRIIKTCNTKCIPKIYNNELAIGEIQCVDRCVGKYLEAQELVTKSVQEYEAKMMEQNKAGVNTGTPRLGGGPPRY